MKCPVCHKDQVIVEWMGTELDICVDGHGVWFDAQELELLLESVGTSLPRELQTGLQTSNHCHKHPKRRCPRCRKFMENVEYPGRDGTVHLDRCPNGHGLWFDEGELEEVVACGVVEGETAWTKIQEFVSSFCRPTSKDLGRSMDSDNDMKEKQ